MTFAPRRLHDDRDPLGVLCARRHRRPARGGAGHPQDPKQAGRDSKVIQSCIKSVKGAATNAERCIGLIATPCLRRPGALSNADAVACASRESSVWDDILNETIRRLGDKLEADQKVKLRDMQRA